LVALEAYLLKSGDKVSFGPLIRSKLIYKFVDNYSPNELTLISSKRKSFDKKSEESSKRFRNDWKELFDSELNCSICQVKFVCPVNLNSAHTFGESCIEGWKHSNNKNNTILSETKCCPICRQTIVSQNRVLALDNVIEYLVNKLVNFQSVKSPKTTQN
jgi:hypothetical protein